MVNVNATDKIALVNVNVTGLEITKKYRPGGFPPGLLPLFPDGHRCHLSWWTPEPIRARLLPEGHRCHLELVNQFVQLMNSGTKLLNQFELLAETTWVNPWNL